MITKTRSISAVLISLSLCGACVQEAGTVEEQPGAPREARSSDALSLGSDELGALTDNGVMLNGIQMNGVKINGVKINGVKINGVKINGVKINSPILSGVALSDFAIVNGTELSGTTELGEPVTYADFEDSTVMGVTPDGDEVVLRIGAIDRRGTSDVLDYTIYFEADDGAWISACGEDEAGQPIPAIPLTGVWNYEEGVPGGGSHIENPPTPMFTFACQSSVLEKCVAAGYKPWAFELETKGKKTKSRSLRPFHQACTRMMRADYCGDGTPHTVENTKIDIWDALKLEAEEASWPLEAEWGVSGATCIRHVRWTSNGASGVAETLSHIQTQCPWLAPSSSCGSKSSTFKTSVGWSTPLSERSLFRNSSCVPTSSNDCDTESEPSE